MKTSSQINNAYDEVQALAAGVLVGNTLRCVCPKCGGGSTKEKSFSISQSVQGRVYFRCFRAKCNWGGKISPSGVEASDPLKPSRLRTFSDAIEPLDENQVTWYREKFHVSPDKDTFWVPSKDMYGYKIRGPEGQHRGYQLRSYTEGATVKALNYIHRDEPFISWYEPKELQIGGVVIVEDIPSARKVASCGIASVALLGVQIDFERAYEIAGKCENFAILALDRGTLMRAIGYRQRYQALWGSVEIWQLQEDLKHVARTRIREAIFDGKSDFISVHSK